VNPDTVVLITRPFQEIVDDILTAIVGGVVNEPILFDLTEDFYPLAQPAADVRGITGTRSEPGPDGVLELRPRTFQKSVDFSFSDTDNSVLWLPKGQRPDDETVFYVDYLRRDSRSPLTDVNVGSVTRTLGEAIGREITTVYQQINEAYRAGFVDTARGQSLDLVVSILGVKRKTKESAVGLVTFFRDAGAGDGNVTIPENTLLSTEKGDATFVTAELRTLQRGQVRVDVPVRATPASGGEKGIVKAGEITSLAQPIAGIARVTNFEATVLGDEDETDEQLRARAKAVLRGLGKATLAALANAVVSGRAKLVESYDPNSPPLKRTAPGIVRLLVESEPERFLSLRDSVEQTRAAGVQATLLARYVYFKPRIRVRIKRGVTAEGKLKIVGEIISALQSYVDALSAGQPAKGDELLKAVASVKEVGKKEGDVRIVDVIASRSDVSPPKPEALVQTLVEAVNMTVANEVSAGATARNASLTAALNSILAKPTPAETEARVKLLVDAVEAARASETTANAAARDLALTQSLDNILIEQMQPVPTGERTFDRSLVKSTADDRAGSRATDEDIEAGQFEVTAKIEGEDWWVVLDVEAADIRLEEV
jgi:hypothetical protein